MCAGVFVTACMKASKQLSDKHYTIVSIEAEVSPGFKGKHFPVLAPPSDLVQAKQQGVISTPVFNLLFHKYLKTLDAVQIIRSLRRLSPEYDLVALVCDSHFKSDSYRSIVAKWLTENDFPTEEVVVNYLKGVKQKLLF